MAWFHFCTSNHYQIGRSTLADMAAWFEAGLLELGHKVTFSAKGVEKGAINLFWEYFEPGMADALIRSGVEYGIIATEIPDGQGFNWRQEPEWLVRFNAFVEVAQRARFIWTMVESTVPFYARFCPTVYIELGFSSRLIPAGLNEPPRFDFCFFGLRTPYREQVVEQLSRYAKVRWPTEFLSADGVAQLIDSSKIGLNFKQSDRWPIPSPTRLGRLMMARRAVAAEYVPVATRQGEIVGICPEAVPFHDYALGILKAGWQHKAEAAFETYRTSMPMAVIMQRVLDSTLCHGATGSDSGSVALKLLPPMLVGENLRWNFVCWGGEYYALRKKLGPVDVTLGIEVLQQTYNKRYVRLADSLEQFRLLL